MKKVVMFCLALLSMFWAVEASARTTSFHAFCKGGLPSNEVLARLLEQSLAHDSAGRTRLSGCMATPVQFLEAFKKGDPDRTDLTLATLSSFVSKDLVLTEIDHSIMWTSSCVRGKSLGAEDVKMNCVNEMVKSGVKVYKDRITGRIVIKLDCANPGLVPAEPPPCATILVEVGDGYTEAGVPVWGDSEDAVCSGYRKVGTTLWVDFTRGCETVTCNYDAADALIGRRHTYVGQMNNLTPGWYEVRVAIRHAQDSAFRIGFCLRGYQDGVLAKVSSNPIVRSIDYRQDGGLVARVYASEGELPRGVSQDAPGGLFFSH